MIAPVELSAALRENPADPLIDVRTPAEFSKVHIPQAVNHPLDLLHDLPGVAREKPVYLVCQSGARAELAAKQLKSAGFHSPIVLRGGTQAWIQAGLPVERGQGGAISLERQVRIGAGSIVLAGVVLGYLIHPGFFGLAGFVGFGLVFAGLTDWCGLGLLLAKAPWNR